MIGMEARRGDRQTVILYDGACYLCSFEMDMYRKKDVEKKLALVDISSPEFIASEWGLDAEAVNRELHVKGLDARWVTGVDSFAVIWETLGINRPLVYLSKAALTRPIFLVGYQLFATVRPYLPKKNLCEGGSCQQHSSSQEDLSRPG